MPQPVPSQHLFPSRVEIDLDALGSNMRCIKRLAGDGAAVMAVVKANAYGHGAPQVARAALENGADMLAVANLAEAAQLREAGIHAPVLTLSLVPAQQIHLALGLDVRVTVYDSELAAQYLAALGDQQEKLAVHLKIDTGMHRLGLLPDEVMALARRLRAAPTVQLEGVYTHFAAADEDAAYTARQLAAFRQALDAMRAAGCLPRFIHAANSPALLDCRDSYFNLVRPGVLLYGLRPLHDSPNMAAFQPAMRWKTQVAQVKTLPAGSRVGYGHAYTTRHEATLAVLPVGYADGLRRGPQTWRYVLLHGERSPLVGRVSMEKVIVDVSRIPSVKIGDEAVLLGGQGGRMISADAIAGWLGSNNYEVVCMIAPRVPRAYLSLRP
ncbi:MAG: alanine racemase [Chloroflexi bacterium]|nr:alanine racemase [Chloroflexota bacterium]MCY4248558.1 alanine racemase [Chloroflexota bacterium]